MEEFSTRPMHVRALEFNAIFWFIDKDCYPKLPIYENKQGDPEIKTVSGIHTLYNEDMIVEFPNKQYMVLKPDEFKYVYFPLLPYS